ncbi:dnaJ homolog subfamily C member 3-like [Watersipora subatra]|uniref:dnaJ homolog subfamily C member 3-like n=1 Tax=Watersipora subatra TaxID=2589382 RepID=UPI00355BCC2A
MYWPGHGGSLALESSFPLLLISLYLQLEGVVAGTTQQDIDSHLEMGKKFLAAGQLSDALSHYHAAVDLDPSNYLTYFKRATVYLAIGKSKSALPDLEKVLDIKPNFHAARIQKGNILLKQGYIDKAEHEYRTVLSKDDNNAEASQRIEELPQLRAMIDRAQYLQDHNDFAAAEQELSKVIESCPWDTSLREKRADCYISMQEYFKAIGDIKATTKLVGDNTAAFYRISDLHYQLGEADDSLREIRECLKLDPDHKQCFPHYKKVKKLVKQMEQAQELKNNHEWDDCIAKAHNMLKTEGRVYHYVYTAKGHICHCQVQAGQKEDALRACDEVLKMNPNSVDAFCDLAELYINEQDYEKAIDYYQKALGVSEGHHRAKEGLETAQKLLKQSKKRDYYKILGVPRFAQKKQIMKAYRKLAMMWHPDRFETEEEKKEAEKKFMDIAAAKEVLTDPEMREKFDKGEDPMDPEQQKQGSHQHPFFHGFNPFEGGSGGSFKFHFN